MIRKDREIGNRDEIVGVLKRCDTVCVGFQGADCPYVVPISFGVIQRGDSVALYFHCAKRGQKIDRLESCARVCVEGHIFHKVEPTPHGITTRYESVIGTGTVERVCGEEAVTGLHSITEHYGFSDYPIESCRGLEMTAVYRIVLDTLTGKRNLPE